MVIHLRAIKYTPNQNIQYKLDFCDEYKDLPQRRKKITVPQDFIVKDLHKNRLPIKYQKWNHLQDLKSVMSIETHHYYDNIPHTSENKENILSKQQKSKIIPSENGKKENPSKQPKGKKK